MFETPAPSSEVSSITAGFADLPPETRNAIYALIFDSPSPFFVAAARGPRRRFKLRERSEESQHDAVSALQTLDPVSRAIRQEVRTFFYATKKFIILPYGYEYLPIFVQWLDSLGLKCRGVLRDVYLAGFMWYKGSVPLTRQFHDLLRSCTSLRKLGVQINAWHLREVEAQSLNAHLDIDAQDPQNALMPVINVSAWAETIVRLPELQKFMLDLVFSVDEIAESFGEVTQWRSLTKTRAILFVEDVEKRLRKMIAELGTGSGGEVEVRYMGTDRRTYEKTPWWW